ncbi:nitrile hydratase subunit alpha [Agilicoccus flavus]|uniref:nitrile hydratase subunit alpha n=1 Tax=Agilicoccus flavus TaxID=2775968 RepID=UPI001CF68A96|nr:nitrile hydratase subunit alpha [Agilicoccus flavus]
MSEHEHDHTHGSSLSEMDARTRALESLLVEAGLVDPDALDAIVEYYEHEVGPHRGARVVALAWTDEAFRERLLADATAAVASLGYAGRQGEHLVALECTPDLHHLVVCTLCSCYPWPVLGLPPVWYKSPAYRAKAVRDPRGVLADAGVTLPAHTAVRVWDSTAEVRYLVVPVRPAGTDGWSVEALADLVTRDAMIGMSVVDLPADRVDDPKDAPKDDHVAASSAPTATEG